ncbi:MAG: helix-turn-helix domain-containing protein [Methylococcaceae bacterium]|nr:helix-turn-helix domain-containing protein [Methylococcaceae bacterium]
MNKYILKEARTRLDLTVKEMALKLNTSQRTYEGWEQGRTIPGIVEVAVNLLESNSKLAKIISSLGLSHLIYS